MNYKEPKDEWSRSEICTGGCCLGYLIGAIGVPVILLLFFALFAPDAFNDGQIGMIFIGGPLQLGPLGAIIGAIAGAIIYRKQRNSTHK